MDETEGNLRIPACDGEVNEEKSGITVKEVLNTGLLEGYPVFYDGKTNGILLRGTIKGIGILCSCDLCKGTRIVTPSQFEIHACKVHRRASQYIFLENGKSLFNVVKECRESPLKSLEETIKTLIGPAPVKKGLVCRNCKGSFFAALAGKDEYDQLCDSCIIPLRPAATPTRFINTGNRRNKRLKMTDSYRNSSGEVINMDETEGNLGIPANNSDDLMEVEVEEESKIRRSTLKTKMEPRKFSNGNSEDKAEKSSKNLEMKMSKKNRENNFVTGNPRTVRELLKTGLLEGYRVFYSGGDKGILLRGTIKGIGIVCSCDLCKGTRVVSARQFEIHACKVYRRASEFIYLENGKSLRNVIQECTNGSLKTLKETIRELIGPAPVKKSLVCRDCKGSFFATPAGKDEYDQLCDSCIIPLRPAATPTRSINTGNRRNKRLKMEDSNHNSSGKVLTMDETKNNSGIPGSSRIRRFARLALMPKLVPVKFSNGNSEGKLEERSGVTTPMKNPKMKISKKKKKRKKISVMQKPKTTTDLLMTGLLEGLPVYYHGGKRGILLRGTISGAGIQCSCDLCKGTRVVSTEQFEIHAYKIKRKASENICFENGKSLRDVIRECMKDSSMTLEETIRTVTGQCLHEETIRTVTGQCLHEETIRTVTGQCPVQTSIICEVCKTKSFLEPLCDSCVISLKSDATPTRSINAKNGLCESSATKQYLERCREKIVLPPTGTNQEIQHKKDMSLDVLQTTGNNNVLAGSIEKEGSKERSSSVQMDFPELVYLERRLGNLERLVARLKKH